MSDVYGYDARRSKMAAFMGVSLAHIEKQYTDQVLYELDVDNERHGRDVTPADLGATCARCNEPTHLTPDELAVAASAVNETHYVSKSPWEDGFLVRPGITVAAAERGLFVLDQFGQINRDRCVGAQVRGALVTSVQPSETIQTPETKEAS